MARMLSPEEMEDVRLTEIADAQRRAARAANSALQAQEGQVKLYDPHHDSLKFGSGNRGADGPTSSKSMIVFGELEAGVAIVAADHPLLPRLLRRHPGIVVMEPGEVMGRTYACELCDGEYPTKRGLANHRKSAHPAPPEPKAFAAKAAPPRPVAKPRRPAPTPDLPDAPEADEADEE